MSISSPTDPHVTDPCRNPVVSKDDAAPPESHKNEPEPDFIKWLQEHSVPITGVVLIVLLLCLIGHYSSTTVDWTKTKDLTDVFRNVTQGLAFIAGGVWAYFKFVKERTFEERLAPFVDGRLAVIDGKVFLVITTQIKNVGLSQITFDKRVSALKVFEYAPTEDSEVVIVADKRLTSFPAFAEKDRCLEPNETIQTQQLIAIPGSLKLAYRLELEVISLRGCIWRANTVVDKSILSDNKLSH
jgi:hypothetical protein